MTKGNLLIVDDETYITKSMKTLLKSYADMIYTADNGVNALKILEVEDIHCVICDIRMPVMNGLELIKNIRKLENDVPFIFYTAHGNHDLMKEVIKYGAFDFIDKPDMEGIEETVKRGLRQGLLDIKENKSEEDHLEFINEYQKLINSFEEKK